MISVATWPGGPVAAATAAAKSAARSGAPLLSRTQPETGRASEAMSDVSGASQAR
jgi:hypothetical protein